MIQLFSTNHNTKGINVSLLIMRIGIALLMFTHGIPKIAKFSETPVQFMDILGLGATVSLCLAIFGEVVCSIFVMLGLGTRLAVIPLIFTMLVAAFYIHSADPFARKEPAMLYLIPYVMLLLAGSGKYALDHLLQQKRLKALYVRRLSVE